jgi:hypothetical protein
MPHQGIVGRKNWREFDVLIQIAWSILWR